MTNGKDEQGDGAGPSRAAAWAHAALFGAVPVLAVVAPLGLVPLVVAAALGFGVLAWRERPSGASGPWALAGLARPWAFVALAFVLWAGASALWSAEPLRSAATALRLLGYFAAAGVLLQALGTLAPAPARPLALAGALGVAIGAAVLLADYLSADVALSRALYRWKELAPLPLVAKSQFNRGAVMLAILVWPLMLAAGRAFGARGRWAAVLGVGALLFAGDSTAARAAFGLGVAVHALAWANARFAFRALRAVALALGLALPFALASLPEPATSRAYDELSPSAHHRIVIWTFAAGRILEKPILGWGLDASRWIPGGGKSATGAIRNAFGRIVAEVEEPYMPLHPHNAFLQWWLELGAVGALLGLGGLWLALVRIERALASPDAPADAAAPAAAAVAAALLVGSVSYGIWQGWWLAGLIAAAALSLVALRATPYSARSTRP